MTSASASRRCCWLPLGAVLCLSLACAPDMQRSRVERMAELCTTHHALPAAAIARLDDEDVLALQVLARDRERPLWLRARAVTLAGARPSDAVHAMWREMRSAPERELRIQAAWAEGLAGGAQHRRGFAARLLHDDDARLREVGAHLLAIAGGERALTVARERIAIEEDAGVRAVLSRKILSKAQPSALRSRPSRAPPDGG